jgi:hypothetical protein
VPGSTTKPKWNQLSTIHGSPLAWSCHGFGDVTGVERGLVEPEGLDVLERTSNREGSLNAWVEGGTDAILESGVRFVGVQDASY